MSLISKDTQCHICFEKNIKKSLEFDCQTENCQFLLCKDCKQKYFVEQHQTTCPGCRLESIDLSSLSKYQEIEELTFSCDKCLERVIKVFKTILYIILTTVLAYWFGVAVLYSMINDEINEITLIILRLIIGYLIIYLISVCIYLGFCLQ